MNRLSGGTDEICMGILKCNTLKELFVGGNPWLNTDMLAIVRLFEKGSQLKLLSLGDQTWITQEQSAVNNFNYTKIIH